MDKVKGFLLNPLKEVKTLLFSVLMEEVCARQSCDKEAIALLTFSAAEGKAWLYDLNEPMSAHTGIQLCRHHANATVVPMSWQLVDSRDPAWPGPSDPHSGSHAELVGLTGSVSAFAAEIAGSESSQIEELGDYGDPAANLEQDSEEQVTIASLHKFSNIEAKAAALVASTAGSTTLPSTSAGTATIPSDSAGTATIPSDTELRTTEPVEQIETQTADIAVEAETETATVLEVETETATVVKDRAELNSEFAALSHEFNVLRDKLAAISEMVGYDPQSETTPEQSFEEVASPELMID